MNAIFEIIKNLNKPNNQNKEYGILGNEQILYKNKISKKQLGLFSRFVEKDLIITNEALYYSNKAIKDKEKNKNDDIKGRIKF